MKIRHVAAGKIGNGVFYLKLWTLVTFRVRGTAGPSASRCIFWWPQTHLCQKLTSKCSTAGTLTTTHPAMLWFVVPPPPSCIVCKLDETVLESFRRFRPYSHHSSCGVQAEVHFALCIPCGRLRLTPLCLSPGNGRLRCGFEARICQLKSKFNGPEIWV